MREFKHITLPDRCEIEKMYSAGMRPVDIAAKLGVHNATIYNELRRGDTGRMDANGRIGYSAKLAQERIYNRRRRLQAAKKQTAEGAGQ